MKSLSKIVISLLVLLHLQGKDACAGPDPEQSDATELKVYPNPVTDNSFSVTSNLDVEEVVLLNILGQTVYKQEIVEGHKIVIELDSPQKGLYLLQVKTIDNRVLTKRILFK